jgi:serine/threonine protein kinase
MTSNLGTTAWCAPELLTATTKARYTVKVDVYSYGMVLWELWERKRPYEELYSRFDIIDAVRAGRRPAIGSGCPAAYRSLIQRCWHEQPARRPTFAYIVRYLKDELAHVKRQRGSSVSGQAFLPIQQSITRSGSTGRQSLDPKDLSKVQRTAPKKNWNFLAPIIGSDYEDPQPESSPTASFPFPKFNFPKSQDENPPESTYAPPPMRLRTAPLSIPQKPSQESLDHLAASPWSEVGLIAEKTSNQEISEEPSLSVDSSNIDKEENSDSGLNHYL